MTNIKTNASNGYQHNNNKTTPSSSTTIATIIHTGNHQHHHHHHLQIWLVKKTPSVAYKTHAAWNNSSCGPQEKTRTAWQAAPE
jgi:hypothetical protein